MLTAIRTCYGSSYVAGTNALKRFMIAYCLIMSVRVIKVDFPHHLGSMLSQDVINRFALWSNDAHKFGDNASAVGSPNRKKSLSLRTFTAANVMNLTFRLSHRSKRNKCAAGHKKIILFIK